MDLLVLDRREFQAMLMVTPKIGVKMLDRLADRLADADADYHDSADPILSRRQGAA